MTWTWSASAGSIRARAVAINYEQDGQTYELNLIDTPGHVDFHYEVSREPGGLRGGDPARRRHPGVQAQTVANAYLSHCRGPGHRPGAEQDRHAGGAPDEIREEIMATPRDRPRRRARHRAAKTGLGVPDVFTEPSSTGFPPLGRSDRSALRALIFDSKFDDYQGWSSTSGSSMGVLRVGQKVRLHGGRHRARGHRPRPFPSPLGVPATSSGWVRSATRTPTSSGSADVEHR